MSSASDKFQKQYKRTATAFLVLFVLSLGFPLVSAIVNSEGKPLFLAGSLDVVIAIACFLLFTRLYRIEKQGSRDLSASQVQKALQYSSYVPLLLLVLFFIGIKLNWEILLVGLAWRYWLLLSALPYLLKAFQKERLF